MQLLKKLGFVVMTLGLLMAGDASDRDSLSSDEGDGMPRTATNPSSEQGTGLGSGVSGEQQDGCVCGRRDCPLERMPRESIPVGMGIFPDGRPVILAVSARDLARMTVMSGLLTLQRNGNNSTTICQCQDPRCPARLIDSLMTASRNRESGVDGVGCPSRQNGEGDQ